MSERAYKYQDFLPLQKGFIMRTIASDIKLKERVKELKCLYELSKISWEADKDLKTILSKTLTILPQAMRYPDAAEVSISINKQIYSTPGFTKHKRSIASPLTLGESKYGYITVGYKNSSKTAQLKVPFLPEEKKLLTIVASQLSRYINRAFVEQEKEKLKMQLQHAERLAFVGELSAGIAHELNEPLGKILGFAQLLKKAGDLNNQQSEDIERIIKASLYTREIIKKLMIFSRQMPQQITSVNLNTVVSNILYFIDVRFQSKGIQIIKQLDHKLPPIQADAVQMSQVLVNLMTNAIHALSGGGKVTVVTRQKGNRVSLTVKDSGTGMSAGIRKKIFEPFFTTKAVGQGTGLGLSVVHGIVESHNGQILVNSVPGKGSKFEIQLPIKQSKP
jgi:two-component system NtrC family sensor kinase